MDFALFLIVNATLFIRPAEIVPDLVGLPIYNVLILLNLAAASFKVAGRLNFKTLRDEPITACVLGFLISIPLSHVAHLNLLLAREGFIEFAKVALYYLLLVAVLDTPGRLRQFLVALTLFVVILAGLALLHYHGLVDIPALDAVADSEVDAKSGEEYVVMRLRSTGIFNDPNDLSLILLVGIATSLFLAGARPGQLPNLYWLGPAGMFLYALTLTHSRGGFLALLAAMMIMFHARFGPRKAALLATLALPAMFVLFAGRQTSISTGEDTGQDRIQLWTEGFTMLRESPVFGIGQNLYAERLGLAAHNSFIQAFAELGLLGGSLFLAGFAYATSSLLSLRHHADSIVEPDLRRLPPFLLAMIVGYGFGMLTLTRNYVIPTFMVLGLANAYFRLVAADSPRLAEAGGPISPLDLRLVGKMAAINVAFLVGANIFIKIFVRRG